MSLTSQTEIKKKHTNRLVNAKSPYLLQHADNPVDWYEWGNEAFEKARKENKPIFLSVGYSACHWCHVLAHESFEDEVTAQLMNEHYVNIKVDREERPDVDRLYMMFLQATSGGGGWPMSVWLTPELHPFFAGTYFPPGRFRTVLFKLAEMWEDDPERCIEAGKQIISELQRASDVASKETLLAPHELAKSTFSRLKSNFDHRYGGFGGAPKFPSSAQTLHLLARYAAIGLVAREEETDVTHISKEEAEEARDMGVKTLVNIYNGGIHDFVGNGFARYSVDERWHVPHFEKMLYDEAQLLTSALEFSQLLPGTSADRETLRTMSSDIVSYVWSSLTSPEGGFYSAEDADSFPTEGSPLKKEGAFYVWTKAELDGILGEDSEMFGYAFGVKKEGNCDKAHDIQGELAGQNVLFKAHDEENIAKQFGKPVEEVKKVLGSDLAKLRAYRDKHRPRPHLDDKILTCWNGLMISALAKAFEILEDKTALAMAERAASFIRSHLYNSETDELRRSYRQGPGPQGQADDYAFLIQGLLDLYEASGKEEYVVWAIRLQETLDRFFYDEKSGGYFASAPDEHVLVRLKDAQDGAEPSAVSVTVGNLQRLAHFAEDRHEEYEAKRKGTLDANSQFLTSAPFALATMVDALLVGEYGMKQLLVTYRQTEPPSAHLALIRSVFIPNRVLVHLDPSRPPAELAKVNATLRSLIEQDGDAKPNVRVCENFTCGLPIEDVEALKKVLPSY